MDSGNEEELSSVIGEELDGGCNEEDDPSYDNEEELNDSVEKTGYGKVEEEEVKDELGG